MIDLPEHPNIAQIDAAVDLGVVKKGLPDIVSFREFGSAPPLPPPQIIAGMLHQGCKMILGGTSKSNKSWSLLDLGLSVSAGADWWGCPTQKSNVLYINFELQPWAIAHRLQAICSRRPDITKCGDTFHLWNLRGYNSDLSLLRPELEEHIENGKFGLIILDPAYKVLGDRDENSNGEIASLFNEFEAIAAKSGAAIVIAHHFAKGDSTAKTAMDRMSGAGAWARDPDAIVVLTPHEEEGCFTVTSILRNLPRIPEFVVEWDYPIMKIAPDLDPDSLRRPQSKNKVCSDRDFMEKVVGEEGKTFTKIVADAEKQVQMSRRSASNYLKRLCLSGLVQQSGGLYWAKCK